MADDSLSKILDEIKKNPELLLTKYLKAEKLVIREESEKKPGALSYRTHKDVIALFTEGGAFFIDEDGKFHQINSDAIQEIVYSADATRWLRQIMLFSASQMVSQLIISKKFEREDH